ncbi:MAG: NAD-dependent epimerase/dehydratase family protein [Actinobacteria bacterium]|nr:NAD-dependent epimerase/dehydratase family protein [Actinomycetota bacterium]MBU1943963.1 NAD-dependent epimerase/dehydratase family protein [Actinomycetota bacterium]MBU2686949.1 NAD-dependent epimerase/dehydratase family protein [Actinomycetota bacterium]
MKKALVTGAAGFIGSNVVKLLLERGVEVRAMVLPGEDLRNLAGVQAEQVQGNILDPATIDPALKGCDTLFHLAAVYSIFTKDRGVFYRVNLQGARNVLWAARRADLEKVVYTSSIAGIGVEPGPVPATEETAFNQFEGCNDYVLTKYLSQEEARTFAREGMPIVIVNPAFPYGEGDVAPTPTGKIILDVANGLQFMAYKGGINIVDVMDVARGHILAAEKGRVGEMYILGNENVTMTELFEMIVRAVGLDVRVVKVPMPLALLYGYLWERWAGLSGHQPMTTATEISYSHKFLFYDISKARTELGYDPAPVEVSMRRAITWFRREGFIPRTGPAVRLMTGLGRLMKRIFG